METHKSCSFFGHREITITEELKKDIFNILEDLISNKNFNTFYFGGFGAFDNLCWQIVTNLKQKYKNIQRVFCLVNPNHLIKSKRPYNINYENYEDIIYLDLKFDYWYTRIYYRNCEIINMSDFVIFYVKSITNSGAFKAMQHAIRTKKYYINICDRKNTP